MNDKALAKSIVDGIFADLHDRRGIGRQSWDEIDKEMRKEILAGWVRIVELRLVGREKEPEYVDPRELEPRATKALERIAEALDPQRGPGWLERIADALDHLAFSDEAHDSVTKGLHNIASNLESRR